MITSFRVQNYKALRDVTLEFTPMHLLIGPNDSGKTSILEALAALSRSTNGTLVGAFEGTWSGRELVWQMGDLPVKFSAEVDGNLSYGLEVVFTPEGRQVTVNAEALGNHASAIKGHQSFVSMSRSSPNATSHLGDAISGVAKQVHAALSGVHYYRWIPAALARPCEPNQVAGRFRMSTDGFGLALVLDDILGYDRDKFASIENHFRIIFPQVRSIKLQRAGNAKGLYFETFSDAAPIPASEISDGILLVLAYLTILNLPVAPRLLLVEEPENGIHPARLRDVLGMLRGLVSGQASTQILLTTHSPYVVDLFKPEEVTLCHKDESGEVRVKRLSDSEKVRAQADVFTLGEIWTGEGDDALARDAVESK